MSDERAPEEPVEKGAPEEPNLGQRATRSLLWSILGYGGGQILRFLSNLILTRLLFEEAFGLMALVNVVLQGLTLFSDIGIGPSIVQNERGDDPRFLNTAWTMQVGRGAALWLGACALAWPVSVFYTEPTLLYLIPVAGFASVIMGFNSTKLFTLSRHLNLKRMVTVDIGSQTVALTVMVVWGLLSPTLWALVAGGLVHALVRLVLSHTVLPGPGNRFMWDRASVSALFSFGRWVFLSTVLTFATNHADRLIFGKLIPFDLLGIYSIGMMLATMPAVAIGHLAESVTFPLFSRVFGAGKPLRPVVKRVRWPFLLLGGWSLSGLLAGGQVAIDLLYDDRYAEAGWIVQYLSVMSWLMILETTNGAVLLATGRTVWLTVFGVSKLVGMVALIPIGFEYWGFRGAVGGFVLAEGLRWAASAVATTRENIGGRPAEAGLSLLMVVSAVVGWYGAAFIRDAGFHVAFAAAGVFVLVSAVWALVMVPFALKVKRQGNPMHVDLDDE